MRQLIPARDVQLGQRVFLRPRPGQTIARDATSGRSFPAEGCTAMVNEYVVGCLQRGALLAFGDDVPQPAAAPSVSVEPTSDHRGEDA